jgi:hypothetical protein
MITRQRVGLILVIFGTVIVAYSIKSKDRWEGDEHTRDVLKRNPGRSELKDVFEPTETRINQGLLRMGLTIVAVGTLLQW